MTAMATGFKVNVAQENSYKSVEKMEVIMTYGPVDFVALEFKGNQFKGEIFPEIMNLVNNGIVRVIDMIVVRKDADGTVTHQEMQETDKSVLAVFDPLK